MHRNAIKQGSEIGVQRSGFRVPSSRFRVPVQGSGSDSEFRVQSPAFRLLFDNLHAKGCNPEPRTPNPEP